MRNKLLVALVLLLSAVAAWAIETPPAAPDRNVEMLSTDLHTLARVTGVATNLNDARQILLAIADNDIETLRMPRGDGTYQWASLQREEGGRVRDEKSIEQVSTEKDLHNVTVTAPNAYRVIVTVPKKRGTFTANNRVWIRNILVDSTAFDGKTIHQEIPVNAWVNPGDSSGIALPDIDKSVKVTAELGVESGSKAAVAEVAVLQAKLVDDPTSPYFPAIKRLLQIRDFAAAKEINRGYLKNAIDEAVLALPGEMEKRTAEQARLIEERKRLVEGGGTRGFIAVGDATPDVINALEEIARMMTGTLQEQTEARAKLEALISGLKPPVNPVVP